MSQPSPTRRRFTLADARALLPTVRERTSDAVQRVDRLSRTGDGAGAGEGGGRARLTDLDEIVTAWAREMEALGVVVKGLWLVDFDNGEGYYCWRYPEATVDHYHGYDDGFAGRMKIV